MKKTGFEYIHQFDSLAKSLARRRSMAEKCYQSCQELYPNLGHDTFIKDLCNRFERSLRSNAPKCIDKVHRKLNQLKNPDSIFVIMEKADTQVVNLRNLLSLSDSVCVSSFIRNEPDVKASIKDQNSKLRD